MPKNFFIGACYAINRLKGFMADGATKGLAGVFVRKYKKTYQNTLTILKRRHHDLLSMWQRNTSRLFLLKHRRRTEILPHNLSSTFLLRKETEMNAIKFALNVLLIAVGFLAGTVYAEGKPDLEDGDVLAHSPCSFDKYAGYCFLVKKNNKHYIAILDQKGELAIYGVKETSVGKDTLKREDVEFLWSRDMV